MAGRGEVTPLPASPLAGGGDCTRDVSWWAGGGPAPDRLFRWSV